MISHKSPVSGVACYGDAFVATAGYDNQLILWDARTHRPLARANHDHLANQCAFTSDGTHLLTASSDYTARVWSVPHLHLRAVLGHHDDDVEMVAPHPSLPLAATASRDHVVRVFDLTGALLHEFRGHTQDVISVVWSEVPDELVSSSDDGTIRRWSMATGCQIAELDMWDVETDTVALDTDGTVYAGNDDGQIMVVRGDTRVVVDAHDAGVKRLLLDPRRSRLVSLSYDRTARIWDISGEHPALVARCDLPADVWPRSCAFAGGDRLAFATFGESYRIFDTGTGVWEPAPAPTSGLNAVAPRAEGDADPVVGDAGIVWTHERASHTRGRLRELGSLCNFLTPVPGAVLTGGQLGKLMDASSGELVYQHRSPLNCATGFERAGRPHALVGTYTGEGLLLRRAAGRTWQFVRALQLLPNAIKGVASNGHLLFAVGADCGATWWDTEDMTEVRTLSGAHDKIANDATWVEGDCFASVSRDLNLRLWAAPGKATVVRTPHTHSVKCVAALRDPVTGSASTVATGSYDGTIALLDLATGAWSDLLRFTTSGISSLAADATTGSFVASSYDGNVYEVFPTGGTAGVEGLGLLAGAPS